VILIFELEPFHFQLLPNFTQLPHSSSQIPEKRLDIIKQRLSCKRMVKDARALCLSRVSMDLLALSNLHMMFGK